jgi:alpha-L-fucosidase 2
MLFQDRGGMIRILPALPAEWPDGRIRGLRAITGFLADIDWANGVFAKCSLKSLSGKSCKMRLFEAGNPDGLSVTDENGAAVAFKIVDAARCIIEFPTKADETYTIQPGGKIK